MIGQLNSLRFIVNEPIKAKLDKTCAFTVYWKVVTDTGNHCAPKKVTLFPNL